MIPQANPHTTGSSDQLFHLILKSVDGRMEGRTTFVNIVITTGLVWVGLVDP